MDMGYVSEKILTFVLSTEGRNFMGFLASFLGVIHVLRQLVKNPFIRRIAILFLCISVGISSYFLKDYLTPKGWASTQNQNPPTKTEYKKYPAKLPKRSEPESYKRHNRDSDFYWDDDDVQKLQKK